jgi:hypothetical protein
MREREGWGSSNSEDFMANSSAPTKGHFEVLLQFDADGALYGSGLVPYIVTDQDGYWGIQLRSGVPNAELMVP